MTKYYSDTNSVELIDLKIREKRYKKDLVNFNASYAELLQSKIRLVIAKKDTKVVDTILETLNALQGALFCEIEHNRRTLARLHELESVNLELAGEIKQLKEMENEL